MAITPLAEPIDADAAAWLRGRLQWERTLGRLRAPEGHPVEGAVTEAPRELEQAA